MHVLLCDSASQICFCVTLTSVPDPRGVTGSNPDSPPPPPSRSPTVFEPVFVQFEILGKVTGAAGAEEFFRGLQYGAELFSPHVFILKMLTFFRGIQRGKNMLNNFVPPFAAHF